jgi:anti-sigma B factor antagonist
MLNVTLHNWGGVAILRCHGRIVAGKEITILRNAALSQRNSSMLLLDLAQVDTVDAGGLGELLGLRTWAHSNGIHFRLTNVIDRVQRMFELTNLDGVFEISSVENMLQQLHRQPEAAWPDRSL